MNILYIGDIMGEPGVKVVLEVLLPLKQKHKIDLVIAQAENVSSGKSMLPSDMKILQSAGVDFFTGGNHTPKRKELYALLEADNQPVIGPANMLDCPGKGWKYAATPKGTVLVISLLGETFGRNPPAINNPLRTIDSILDENKNQKREATIVNFHGDFSSEKRIIGYYLDGRVTAVIGDHWHVPTADAMVLPKGTAHITDVGMSGSLHSSLGVKLEAVIPRWRDNAQTINELEGKKPYQFNAVLIETNDKNQLVTKIKPINKLVT